MLQGVFTSSVWKQFIVFAFLPEKNLYRIYQAQQAFSLESAIDILFQTKFLLICGMLMAHCIS